MSPQSTLFIGGCRSGKSSHALEMADRMGRRRKVFVATCVPHDEEMQQRVKNHRNERGEEWQTIETPLDISQVLTANGDNAEVILIDCLTLWVSNLLMQNENLDFIQTKARELATAIEKCTCPVILVTNEVGLGIVPENRLARLFRDAAGFVNQTVAAACQQVVMTVAGIAVTIK